MAPEKPSFKNKRSEKRKANPIDSPGDHTPDTSAASITVGNKRETPEGLGWPADATQERIARELREKSERARKLLP